LQQRPILCPNTIFPAKNDRTSTGSSTANDRHIAIAGNRIAKPILSHRHRLL
jgi:hypothetical protein